MSNSKNNTTAILGVVAVALLFLSGYLWYTGNDAKTKLEKTTAQYEETSRVNDELNRQYEAANLELEEMKTDNEELNAIIEQQQAELKEQKAKIARNIRNGKNLGKAKEEIASLSAQLDQYLAEINTLRNDKEALTARVTELNEAKETLTADLAETTTAKETLEGEKAQLVSLKTDLETKNSNLTKTVTKASVLAVSAIEVTGFKMKDSGKAAKKRTAKNVDRLQICFNNAVNEVANAGDEEFFVRVINPVGETLAIEELGSGVLVNADTNEEVRYTMITPFAYDMNTKQHCAIWEPKVAFTAGNYKVEVYNKGYLAGKSSFVLK